MKKFKPQSESSAEHLAATFRELHGFGGGDQVHYTPDYKELGYTIGSLRHPHKVYTIWYTAHQGDGTPVAWLNGVSGCVPISRLSHVNNGDTAA